MSKKQDFTDIDQAILARITKGGCRFEQFLSDQSIRPMAAALNQTGHNWNDFRVIDRRLQAMRKAGLIQYDTLTGWSLVVGGGEG